METVATEIHDGALSVVVDETIYSREAVLRTCYWFTDRCYLFISRSAPGQFTITVRAKPDGQGLDSVAGDFTNALLDQQLRIEIAGETRILRELIVAKAFAEGNALDDAPVGDDRDPIEKIQPEVGPGGVRSQGQAE